MIRDFLLDNCLFTQAECDLLFSNTHLYVYIAAVAVIFHIILLVIPKGIVDIIFMFIRRLKRKKLVVVEHSTDY